jgi:hypothetical protein
MKVLATLLSSAILCSVGVFAEDATMTAATAGCGPKEDKMKVSSGNSKDLPSQPEPGKALVYVIQDDGVANKILGGGITWRIGMDGGWVTALNRHNPYTAFSVTPGGHHLCTNWQSTFGYLSKAAGVAHLDAEAEKTYYFRVREWEAQTVVFVDLAAVDGDQAKLLIALQPANAGNKK